jgi:hypothetical protein
MSNLGVSPAERLCSYFSEVIRTPRMAGALVLGKLSDLASASIIGASAAQDAVAFALSEAFSLHSEDLEDRPVTSDALIV